MFNGILFQESLQDLVKGIRAHRRDEESYIRTKLRDIYDECRSSDATKKANAVLKLTHLQMMGYNISSASFHIIEVMSNSVFASKRIGYLAAAQSFSPTTDVLLLTTNQFKKDLTNGKLQDCSQALTCLAKLITEELGRDLEKDVSLLLNSPRPYIRKKAVLVLYRLIMVHPDTLPIVSSRFRERLTDTDPGVLCAAVTVTTELARASPSTFLSLAPLLYHLLMNKDSNNWMLIKIVKLMGVLTPLEPRLAKKLVEPLTSLMRTTRAKSLLYECCSTVTAGLMAHPEAVELAAARLGEFMDDTDQNLKYLGLLSMRKLIQTFPHIATEHRDNILDCLDDEDIGIRMRALELVSEFATKRTLRDISRILLRKLRKASRDGFVVEDAFPSDPVEGTSPTYKSAFSAALDQAAPYREALARQLLRAGEYKRPSGGQKGGYEMLSSADDFAWYMTTIIGGLGEIPMLPAKVRDIVADQFLELTSRVEALRPVSVKVAFSLLSLRLGKMDGHGTSDDNPLVDDTNDHAGDDGMPSSSPTKDEKPIESGSADAVLSPTLAGNTAWILGEYAELLADYVTTTQCLVNFPKRGLDSAAQVRILTASIKIFANCRRDQAAEVHKMVSGYVASLIDNHFAEVQERAWFFNSLLEEFGVDRRMELAQMFVGKLIPVDPRAQSKVPVSSDLDLDTPLLDTGSDSLYSYLLKTIGDGSEFTDDEGGEDDDTLFKEAVFSSVPLSFGPTQAQSGTTGNAVNTPTMVASNLPPTPTQEKKEDNPFYLNGSSSGAGRLGSHDEDQFEASRYAYDTSQMSSEAAVLTTEENPLGLGLDEEDGGLGGKRSQLSSKMQAAFDGAFVQGAAPRAAEVGKKEKKKKKKKKAAGGAARKTLAGNRETGTGSATARGTASRSENSLIDFGSDGIVADPVTQPTPPTTKPKHLADTLLM